jgi:hypothetical protein
VKIAITIVAIMALATCSQGYGFDKRLPSCGSAVSTGFSGRTVEPAERLSETLVGFGESNWTDTVSGSGSEYSLLSCESGVKVSAARFVLIEEEPSTTGPTALTDEDLEAFVLKQTENGNITSQKRFYTEAENAGFSVTASKLFEDNEHGNCACQKLLPQTEREWTAIDEDVLKRRQAIGDFMDSLSGRLSPTSSTATEGS